MIRVARAVLPTAIFITGWGWTDVSGFSYSLPRIWICLLIAFFAVLSFPQDLRGSMGSATSARQLWVALIALTGLAAIFCLVAQADRRDLLTMHVWWIPWAGLALFALGGILQFVSLRTLGHAYSPFVTLQARHRLVQAGPYRFLRHPMYLGLVLKISGVMAVFRSWLILPVTLAAFLFVGFRIREEEQLLDAHFGSQFRTYRKRTKRLIPFLY